MGYVFISYSSKNQQEADATRALLKEENIACWMAPYDIPAGSKYATVINDALENCSCLLLLLTESAQHSEFVYREIERAVTYGKAIIPMQLEDCKLTSAFKFYIGSSRIVAVRSLDRNSEEVVKVLKSVRFFVGGDQEQEEEERKHNAILNIGDYKDVGGGYVTFGAYPQSKKAGNVTIGELFDSERGYYLGSDNCLYEKYANMYYKVEPIKWKVLSRGGELFVVTDDILDAHCFDGSSNNYANSEIRRWLNDEFYNKAFDDSQKVKIVTTTVDNSLSSTGDSSNKYICGNTSDKVFLLSRKEANQYFGSSSARQKKGTDYAKARGLWVASNGNSWWWLRSPCYRNSTYAQCVILDGGFRWCDVDDDDDGVVCALKFKP